MITVHIWHPRNTPLNGPVEWTFGAVRSTIFGPDPYRWGHGGIEFRGITGANGHRFPDAYRSFWPGEHAEWTDSSPGRVITERAYDVEGEGTEPTRSIRLASGLNESLVYQYWYGLGRMPLNYHWKEFNCCSAVAGSIRDGFPQGTERSAPAYRPISYAGGYFPLGFWTPYSLEAWVRDVNAWLVSGGVAHGPRDAAAVAAT